ncbi:grasp-with-spasm system SPASM domain peptide maturase [Flavobacterium sp.]|uniref:grasp-with-spasm system SPASM domain peptide maturase n=1 Tax=Flavobacterium sp. TaxID=239 RepID=UPI003D6A625A
MSNFDKYFVFFSTCFAVNGYNRSLILDLQRRTFLSIPNTMYEIIDLFNSKKSIGEIIEFYGIENSEIINEYVDYLLEKEFGFIANYEEFDNFPAMNRSFEVPSLITNSIIEISHINLGNIKKIIQNLNDFNCTHVQFISYDKILLNDLILLLKESEESDFKSIQFILKYTDEVFEFLPQVINYNKRVTEILFHSSEDITDKIIPPTNFNINFLEYAIRNFKFCGVVNEKYFNQVNKERVLESLNHNSCLYKKIAIDEAGNIKNCPALKKKFGNIQDITLQNAIEINGFTEFWDIKKDEITTCKDCEFRHVCTDCRAFLENPKDKHSKPLKCGYNPYDNIWEDWSLNPLKEEALTYYGFENLKM